MRQYELVERVKAYDPDADEDLLNRAYVFAMKAHGAQLRASGDPYFHHPVEVAGILTGCKLDSASIATAPAARHGRGHRRHPRRDRAPVRRGRWPAWSTASPSSTGSSCSPSQTAQAENFRKLLLAMSEDIRVLLVKLADRLHNMRTLHFIKSADKRRRIARRDAWRSTPRWPSGSAWRRSRPSSRTWPSPSCGPMRARACCTGCAICARDDGDLVERIVAELSQTPARRRHRGRDLRPREDARSRSGARWSARTSASSSCPTSWRSASRSTACPTATRRSA